MQKQIATIGIVVQNFESIEQVNRLLHDFSNCIISRMGMPYPEREIRLIHVVMDTYDEDVLNLVEKINGIGGVTAQAMFF